MTLLFFFLHALLIVCILEAEEEAELRNGDNVKDSKVDTAAVNISQQYTADSRETANS